MKKILAVVLGLVLLMGLTACGSSSDNEGGLTLTDGVLMVGMEIGYPPMEYFDEDGATMIGFDVEVAQAIADYMELDLEIVDTAWDGIFTGVTIDNYDCIISAVSITDDRQEDYNLTEPYVANRIVMVTRKDSGISTLEELDGKSVAVQAETTADVLVTGLIEDGLVIENYNQYEKILTCFDDLKTERVDAVLVDSVVAAYYMGEDAALYDIVWESDEPEPMAICLKKGNDELTAEIEAAVDALYADGTFATIATKYFGYDVTEGLR